MRNTTKFLVLLLLIYIVVQLPFVRTAIERTWTHSQVQLAVTALELLYEHRLVEDAPEMTIHQNYIVYPAKRVRVAEGCNAVLVLLLLASAILASQTRPLRQRLLFLVAAVAWVYPLNVVRIAHLAHLSYFDPESFQTAHLQVWQIGFILTAVGYMFFTLYLPNREAG